MAAIPYHARHTGTEVDDAVDQTTILWEISGNQLSGSYDIPNGASSGSVSLLSLPFWPARVFLQVEAPVGGSILFAVVRTGSMSLDGFDFALSGSTNTTLHRLHYLIFGEDANSNDSNMVS